MSWTEWPPAPGVFGSLGAAADLLLAAPLQRAWDAQAWLAVAVYGTLAAAGLAVALAGAAVALFAAWERIVRHWTHAQRMLRDERRAKAIEARGARPPSPLDPPAPVRPPAPAPPLPALPAAAPAAPPNPVFEAPHPHR